MGYTNTLVYEEEWATKLQQRLSDPIWWKDVCRVEYTNKKVIHNPYLTDPTVGSLSRGTAYTFRPITETDDYITINSSKYTASFIDRADLAQSTFLRQMELAALQGTLLNESLESAILADHATWTDFDNAAIGGSAGNITVSVTNIDDIINGLIREIMEAYGAGVLARNGGFVVWRPADFEKLKSFMMANGFNTADMALSKGVQSGIDYMGLTHYVSNRHTSGHLFAGVRKMYHVGILKDTYGQIVVNDKDPGLVSGIGVTSRVDYGLVMWVKALPVCFDVTVA